MEKELQRLIDAAKTRLLAASGKEQEHLLSFITSCLNAIAFIKWADEAKPKDKTPSGF